MVTQKDDSTSIAVIYPSIKIRKRKDQKRRVCELVLLKLRPNPTIAAKVLWSARGRNRYKSQWELALCPENMMSLSSSAFVLSLSIEKEKSNRQQYARWIINARIMTLQGDRLAPIFLAFPWHFFMQFEYLLTL